VERRAAGRAAGLTTGNLPFPGLEFFRKSMA